MSDADIIDRVVEFCLTHTEHYSLDQEPGAVKLSPDSSYWVTARQEPADKHRQARIAAWQGFARAALG